MVQSSDTSRDVANGTNRAVNEGLFSSLECQATLVGRSE